MCMRDMCTFLYAKSRSIVLLVFPQLAQLRLPSVLRLPAHFHYHLLYTMLASSLLQHRLFNGPLIALCICGGILKVGGFSGIQILSFCLWLAPLTHNAKHFRIQCSSRSANHNYIHTRETPNTTVFLSWSVPSGSVVESYVLEWSSDQCPGDEVENSTTISGTLANFTISDLRSDSSYSITVTASNAAGNSTSKILTVHTHQ